MGCLHQRTACRALSAAALLALICLVVAGCGGGSGSANKATVEGKVTYKGKPVTGGSLNLVYDSGTAFPVPLNPTDGTFKASNVPPGKVTITVNTKGVKTANENEAQMAAKMPKDVLAAYKAKMREHGGERPATDSIGTYVEIPSKYEQKTTSPLHWELTAGSNRKDIDLEP